VQEVHPLGVQEVHPIKDQGLTYKLKVVAEARTRGSRPAKRRTNATPATFFTSLDGWEISDALRAEWLQISALPCTAPQALALLEARVSRLRRRPIGGAKGVTDRDGYVRDHLEQWGRWERENLEKAQRRAGLAPRTSFHGGGDTWEPSQKMKGYAVKHGLDIDTLTKAFVQSGAAAELGGRTAADEAFIKRLVSAARAQLMKDPRAFAESLGVKVKRAA
jgi:hypothetical protein